jgi:hypothetical protein
MHALYIIFVHSTLSNVKYQKNLVIVSLDKRDGYRRE